jgi:putative transposase
MSLDSSSRRLKLIDQVLHLPDAALEEAEAFLRQIQRGAEGSPVGGSPPARPSSFDWPHAPLHRLTEHGTYMVTAATYGKEHYFRGPDRLDYLQATLFSLAKETGWRLEAWALFSNHYHFIAHALPGAADLREFLSRLHRDSAGTVNAHDGCAKRKVWFNFWETALTFEKSYRARLRYVHQNPVKHALTDDAREYPWCSAAWFERTATPAQVKVVASFKTDKLNVGDDYEPVW